MIAGIATLFSAFNPIVLALLIVIGVYCAVYSRPRRSTARRRSAAMRVTH